MRVKRCLRPLIGIVVAYAVAAQSLLIALGGFAVPANASDGAPAFTLCLHNSDSAPSVPAGIPDHTGCSHCIFCFAGAHHAAVTPPSVVLVRAQFSFLEATWIADEHSPPRLVPYAIASPRGPPRA
jgi:polyferredoxin